VQQAVRQVHRKSKVTANPLDQARRELQRGPGKHSRGAPLERKFFSFLNGTHSGVLYIFERWRGPKRCGVRGNLPFVSPLSTGLHLTSCTIVLKTSKTCTTNPQLYTACCTTCYPATSAQQIKVVEFGLLFYF